MAINSASIPCRFWFCAPMFCERCNKMPFWVTMQSRKSCAAFTASSRSAHNCATCKRDTTCHVVCHCCWLARHCHASSRFAQTCCRRSAVLASELSIKPAICSSRLESSWTTFRSSSRSAAHMRGWSGCGWGSQLSLFNTHNPPSGPHCCRVRGCAST
jgi:hypothetical protein